MSSPFAVAEDVVPDDLILMITQAGRYKIIELRDGEPEGKQLGLRLEILADTGAEFTYDLSFQELVKADFSDIVRNHGGLRVIIPAKDAPNLEGATLDFEEGGLVLRNPNKPRPMVSLGTLTANDALSDQVRGIVVDQINPSLDAHGGFVTYVGHDGEGRVYMTMGGGCHGCSMSKQTMLQGVQSTLKELIPGIERVVDATDHSVGENPYYA
jgi:Fe/S biogenesis protein NfuA